MCHTILKLAVKVPVLEFDDQEILKNVCFVFSNSHKWLGFLNIKEERITGEQLVLVLVIQNY